jgi:2-dehydropantoate 2-reductase
MRILIQGAGSVGLGLGSFLLAAGHQVAFLGRKASVEALRTHGLRRTGRFGWHTAPAETFEAASSMVELAEPTAAAPDFVLIAVKSFDSAAAAAELAEQTARLGDAPLVLCQNGWGNAETFAARFPEARVWNARVITGFRRAALHHVDVTVHAEPVRIGSLFGQPAARVARLCDALTAGGLPSEATDTIGADLWAKLLYNGCLNPACAILGVPYGALGASPPGRALIESLAHEIFAVMHAAGWRTHWASADAWLEDFFERLLPVTAEHESSMLQDLRAGRRTEIDALTGAIVRLGEKHGTPAPANAALLRLVEVLDERRG